MNQNKPSETAPNSSSTDNLLGAFAYPIHKQGIAPLLTAGLVGLGMQLVFHLLGDVGYRKLGLIIFLSFILGGCVLGYVLHVIVKTATGKDTPPDWQDISGREGIVRPMVLISLALLFSFGPFLGWLYALHQGYMESSPICWGLLVWGCFYFPMALTAAAMMENLSPLNPVLILVSIFRAGWVYAFAFVTIAIVTMGVYFLSVSLRRNDYLFSIIEMVCLMYLLMVTGRSCGLIYRLRREKLNWPCE